MLQSFYRCELNMTLFKVTTLTGYNWPVENIARWKLCQVTTLPGSNFARWQLCQVTTLPSDHFARWQLCQVANLLGNNCVLTICQVTITDKVFKGTVVNRTWHSIKWQFWQTTIGKVTALPRDIFARWLIRLLIVYKNDWKNDRFIFCFVLKTIVSFLEKRWITTNEPFVLNFWKAKNETKTQHFFGKTIVFLIYLINMSFLTYTSFYSEKCLWMSFYIVFLSREMTCMFSGLIFFWSKGFPTKNCNLSSKFK